MYGEKQAGSALQYRKFYHLFFCKFKEKNGKKFFFFPEDRKKWETYHFNDLAYFLQHHL